MTAKPKPTHEELQQQIIELGRYFGWRHLHVRRSIGKGRKWVTTTNVKGWPDLLLWSPRQPDRHLAIEVKVPPDDLSVEQGECLAELKASGFETYVVTPEPTVRTTGFDSLAHIFDRPHTAAGSPLP